MLNVAGWLTGCTITTNYKASFFGFTVVRIDVALINYRITGCPFTQGAMEYSRLPDSV
jgi:hypothetical protein